jgi:hypothetical protein
MTFIRVVILYHTMVSMVSKGKYYIEGYAIKVCYRRLPLYYLKLLHCNSEFSGMPEKGLL